MKRLVAPALLLCLVVSAAWAAGFPYMQTSTGDNTVKQARVFPVIDTLVVPLGNKFRSLYLIAPALGTVRANIDSLTEAWRNGGATPKFKRIQHIILWNNSVDEEEFKLTLFHGDGTSHMRWVNQAYRTLDLPFEADSIQVQAEPVASFDLHLGYVLW